MSARWLLASASPLPVTGYVAGRRLGIESRDANANSPDRAHRELDQGYYRLRQTEGEETCRQKATPDGIGMFRNPPRRLPESFLNELGNLPALRVSARGMPRHDQRRVQNVVLT